ncbi:MAG: hypothetical protein WCK15_22010, partial [Pirellula sp.]
KSEREQVKIKFGNFATRLKTPDFQLWSEVKKLLEMATKGTSQWESYLNRTDDRIAKNAEAIKGQLKKGSEWVETNGKRMDLLIEDRNKLVESLKELFTVGKKAVARGDETDQADMEEERKAAVSEANKALKALDLEGGRKAIDVFEKAIEGLQGTVQQKFESELKKVNSLEQGEYARVYGESSSVEQQDLNEKIQRVKDILNPDTGELLEAKKQLLNLEEQIKSIDEYNETIKKAKAAFEGTKQRYEAIMQIETSELQNPKEANALERLKGRLVELWEFINNDENDWFVVADDILVEIPKLAGEAERLVKSDSEAKKALAEAQEEEERLRQEEEARLEEEARERQRVLQEARERNKLLGIQAGDQLYRTHSSDIIQRVWTETKKYIPSSQNCGIRGVYRYTDIMAAISSWRGRVDIGLFNSVHVPGGGRIQDKRTKNPSRNEIQANFISDWDSGNPINVHVDLSEQDWHLVRIGES